MARILFGVMGDAFGHVTRAQAVAEEAREHEFMFLGGGRVGYLKEQGYRTLEAPMLATYYRDNKVDVAGTVNNGLNIIFRKGSLLRPLCEEVERFQPDLVLSDYEHFSQLIAKRLGLKLISVDNQHLIIKCKIDPPREELISRLLLSASMRLLYNHADYYFIASFFQPPALDPETTEVFPTLLRNSVKDFEPVEGEHALVYQTTQTFAPLLERLKGLPFKFRVHGLGNRPQEGNITFRPHTPSGELFLEDLAGCKFVIANGGGNVISEALYFGKPVFSFPIKGAYEQFLNAYMLKKLGYGDYCDAKVPDANSIMEFSRRVENYKENISKKVFFGNAKLCQALNRRLAVS
jgi:uncharacterized protein (TIGR00661 family)